MLSRNKSIKHLIVMLVITLIGSGSTFAQTAQPKWWFGMAGAANFNFYDGTTQRLSNDLFVPTAFHDGKGVKPFGAFQIEYLSGKALGAFMNIGYDGKGGKFDGVIAPCDCPATLETNLSYLTVEPNLRLSAGRNFYLFAGPRVAFNLDKDFNYTQEKQPNTDADLSQVKKTILSGQVGMGVDIPLSAPTSLGKVVLSPFVSYHPYFGQEPRDIESWSITTIRAGLALKFAKSKKIDLVDVPAVIAAPDVSFSVRAPKVVPKTREVSETLPLRNYVFFDEGSAEIPQRFVQLNPAQASAFKEVQLQNREQAGTTGRSARQLNVYYNILNITGDRMRNNPGTSINLSGASMAGPQEGKLFAENVKSYLVNNFGINASRISTDGRTKPVLPSEQPGGTKELLLLREGDRRVDLTSNSPELIDVVGGGMMKPVMINSVITDPLDSHVIFTVAGAKDLLKSWTLDVTNEQGNVQHLGPFTKDVATVPGSNILGNRPEGQFKVLMTGETNNGLTVRKESTVRLMRPTETLEKAHRFSILFDFDKSESVASYEKFLTDVVSPLIANGSEVVIHGYTDIIGSEQYNDKLSQERAAQTQRILENSLSASGKSNVSFRAIGFGEDLDRAPFENNTPEQRFYNRTVIIDIVPGK